MTIRPEDAYFFGIWKGRGSGHYLYDFTGRGIRNSEAETLFPFQREALDGYLLPNERILGRRHPAWFSGWSLMTMWENSGMDKRPGCNASFIFPVEHLSIDDMTRIALELCPIATRIKEAYPDEWS